MTKPLLIASGIGHERVMLVLRMQEDALKHSPVILAGEGPLIDCSESVCSSLLRLLDRDFFRETLEIKQFFEIIKEIDSKIPFLNKRAFVNGREQEVPKRPLCSAGQKKIKKCFVERRGRR